MPGGAVVPGTWVAPGQSVGLGLSPRSDDDDGDGDGSVPMPMRMHVFLGTTYAAVNLGDMVNVDVLPLAVVRDGTTQLRVFAVMRYASAKFHTALEILANDVGMERRPPITCDLLPSVTLGVASTVTIGTIVISLVIIIILVGMFAGFILRMKKNG